MGMIKYLQNLYWFVLLYAALMKYFQGKDVTEMSIYQENVNAIKMHVPVHKIELVHTKELWIYA